MNAEDRPEGRPSDATDDGTDLLTDEQRTAELLLLDRLGAVRCVADAVLVGRWMPTAPITGALADLARAAALDARRVELLAEPAQR